MQYILDTCTHSTHTHTHTFASEILTEFFRVVTGNITLEMVSTTHPTRSPQPGPGSRVPPAWGPSAGSAVSFLTVCVRGVKVDCEPQEIGSLKRLCISNGREETNLLQVTYQGGIPAPHTHLPCGTPGVSDPLPCYLGAGSVNTRYALPLHCLLRLRG